MPKKSGQLETHKALTKTRGGGDRSGAVALGDACKACATTCLGSKSEQNFRKLSKFPERSVFAN
jgi:hypothetical protein